MIRSLRAAGRSITAVLALAVLGLVASAGAAAPQVLRPEQAFRYRIATEGSEIVLRWAITPGHYLYKERMSVVGRSPGATLGTPSMPEGIPHEDEFFGPMTIYRGDVELRIPVAPPVPGTLDLEIRSQGCADIGLCYPPQSWPVTVRFAATAAASPKRPLASLLGGTAPGRKDAPLPPEEAFRVTALQEAPGWLSITWDIAAGYYLYRDSIEIGSPTAGVTLGAPQLPPGETTDDEEFGLTEVFRGPVQARLPISGRSGTVALRIAHQGCKDGSICYPPQRLSLTLDDVIAGSSIGTSPMVSEQNRLTDMVRSGHLALVMLSFAGFGLLLSFTPCCLPMVPILSGIIVGQGPSLTPLRAFTLSLTYVLGMALTYTAAGALFAAAGSQLQAALQQPWIIIGVALLFAALALSMFGVYELQVPAAVMNRLDMASARQRVGSYFGTAVMGALSALVVTTCVAPPLVATLTVIAGTGDVARGALALFALALGMGLPLLVIGTSAGRLLPKAGEWMNTVKGAFGFMLLGLAIWMLDRLLADTITMMLWAVLVFMAGIFLGALQKAPAGAGGKIVRGAGVLAMIYGLALFAGALAGGSNPLQPLAAFRSSSSEEAALRFQRIKTVEDFVAAQAAAQAAGQPLLLDFYADWCTSCIEMERHTFSKPEVHAALDAAVLLQADVTANDAADRALLAHFGIFGPPTILFYGVDGRERSEYRLVGFLNAADFAAHARRAFGS